MIPSPARVQDIVITPSDRNVQIAFSLEINQKRFSVTLMTAGLSPAEKITLDRICSGAYSMGEPRVLVEDHGWSLRLPYHSGGVKIADFPPKVSPPKREPPLPFWTDPPVYEPPMKKTRKRGGSKIGP